MNRKQVWNPPKKRSPTFWRKILPQTKKKKKIREECELDDWRIYLLKEMEICPSRYLQPRLASHPSRLNSIQKLPPHSDMYLLDKYNRIGRVLWDIRHLSYDFGMWLYCKKVIFKLVLYYLYLFCVYKKAKQILREQRKEHGSSVFLSPNAK